MTRREILLFQLNEARNEFANILDGLTSADMLARPLGRRNPIVWIVYHCMQNFNFFLYELQNGQSLLTEDGRYSRWVEYEWNAGDDDSMPGDSTGLTEDADSLFAACIEVIAALDEEKLSEKAMRWKHEVFESVAGNCIRVINHTNAHLRQIWMIRGALKNSIHWPVQTLKKNPDDPRGGFFVPDRA